MNFVVDEGVDRPIIVALRNEGHHVLSIGEKLPGKTDEDILRLANEVQAILVTTDKDFGELVYRLKKIHNGILLLRLSGLNADRKVELVRTAIENHAEELNGSFSVLSSTLFRIRREVK